MSPADTLLGPGGIGKTRLVLRVAAAARLAHGICFVSLGDITAAEQVAPSVATRLGLQRMADQRPEHALLAFLRNREVLLILDSVEHLLAGDQDTPDGVPSVIGRILDTCPRVKLLVTSRERLKLQPEWVFPVAGLAVAEGARALFVLRAQRVHPAFRAQVEEPHIDALCRLVEGMPLAIELAASWTPVMSCAQLRRQLSGTLTCSRPGSAMCPRATGASVRCSTGRGTCWQRRRAASLPRSRCSVVASRSR